MAVGADGQKVGLVQASARINAKLYYVVNVSSGSYAGWCQVKAMLTQEVVPFESLHPDLRPVVVISPGRRRSAVAICVS